MSPTFCNLCVDSLEVLEERGNINVGENTFIKTIKFVFIVAIDENELQFIVAYLVQVGRKYEKDKRYEN